MLDPSMYGTTLTFNGKQFVCIAPSQEQVKVMMQTAYELQQPATFSMRVTDFNTSGIGLRSTIQSNGLNFEVYSTNSDDVDVSVDLKVFYKQ